ncbi:MAG TPA: nucleotidyltransferase domain-containing protein [Candidatus Woesearchaeota archaeon]|nr:nucleotidyltransferase domain-containing protein [Candidatus Woesearchaeota archaeon]
MVKITKNKIEILNYYRKNLFLNSSIREISLNLKKPYPKIFNAVKELEKENIIMIKKLGPSSICEIHLSKETISILSFIEKEEAFKRKIPNIDKILEFDSFLDDILIVTGSYAKGTQTKKSDLDLVIITKDDVVQKQKLMENQTMLFTPEVHVVAFSYDDFKKMLLSKEPDFGKEVFKNRLIFRNSDRYYLIVKEAISNGFRMENLSY